MKSKLLAGKSFDLKSLTKAKEPDSIKSESSIIDKKQIQNDAKPKPILS